MADFTIPIIDHAGDVSSVRIPVPDAIADLTLTALFSAVDGMTVGNLGQSTLDIATPKNAGPGGNPADKHAQIELKWLAQYHDAVIVTDLYTMELPCADASLLSTGTENMDLGAGAGATFKTQFDATVKASKTGNAVVLDEVTIVGRNL